MTWELIRLTTLADLAIGQGFFFPFLGGSDRIHSTRMGSFLKRLRIVREETFGIWQPLQRERTVLLLGWFVTQ